MYNKLNKEQGIPAPLIIVGLAIALLIFSFVLLELIVFLSYIFFSLFGSKTQPPQQQQQQTPANGNDANQNKKNN